MRVERVVRRPHPHWGVRVPPVGVGVAHPHGGGEPQEAPLEGCEAAARGGGVPAPEFAGGAADEDVVGRGVDHPVVALAGVVVVSRNLHE